MNFNSVLITGGAGFIGSSIAFYLREKYPEVRIVVLDNLSRLGSKSNVKKLRSANILFIRGDICKPSDLAKVGEIDCLIECSAEPSVLAGITSPATTVLQTNVIGTFQCLEYARQHKAFFIFLSTSRVYSVAELSHLPLEESESRYKLVGPARRWPTGLSKNGISEHFSIQAPRSLLGTSKRMSEELIEEYWHSFEMHGVINRCGIVAGPGQFGRNDQGILMYWLSKLLWGGALTFTGFDGTGKQVRDFLHVMDLVRLIDDQMRSGTRYDRQIMNVGGGITNTLSLQEMHGALATYLGVTKKVKKGNQVKRKWDIPWYVTDISVVQALNGWQPTKTINDLIDDSVMWMKNNESELRQFFIE
jgi:CDP-paratose 2-epimerase